MQECKKDGISKRRKPMSKRELATVGSEAINKCLVCSVCTIFPIARRPLQGGFVYRRIDAMSKLICVKGIRPQPFFPIVKPFRLQQTTRDGNVAVAPRRMYYLPKIGNQFNGVMLSRCLSRWIGDNLTGDRQLVIDAHFGYPEGVGCYHAAKKFNLPVFITLRGLEQPLFGTPIGDQIVEALNGCNGVIAVSESLRDAAISAGANAVNIKVIPNGIDHAVFRPSDLRAQGKSECSNESVPLLVSVGNLKHVKGQDVLLRAFHQLIQERPARLVLIGGDDESRYASKQRDFVTSHGLSDVVDFVGSIPPSEVNKWLQRANLFVLASRREGCCNAILEALACGLPVVATTVGDNHRFVRKGSTGRLVASDNFDQLATAIGLTLDESYDRNEISRTVEFFSWENTAKSVVQFFQSRLGVSAGNQPSC